MEGSTYEEWRLKCLSIIDVLEEFRSISDSDALERLAAPEASAFLASLRPGDWHLIDLEMTSMELRAIEM